MKKNMKVFIFLLLASVFVCHVSFALHPFYEQNGECYLMIGEEGAVAGLRGVYALNNLTGKAVERLYDPLDAYGMAAFQKWDGAKSLKDIFTFAGVDTGWVTVTEPLERKVVMTTSTKIYKSTEVPEETIHRFHSSPSNSATGKGNHNSSVVGYKYSGTCYPCSNIPSAVPGKSGYYYIPPGKFYHAHDLHFWARWAYGCWHNLSVEYPKDPDAFKDVCCCRGGQRTWGGWAHWVVRENVMAKHRNLKLYNYNVNTKKGPTMTKDVATVQTEVKSTLDKKGECYDGCIGEQNGIPLPGGEMPYLDCVFSSIGKTYLYRRAPSSTDYLLTGTDAKTKIIGEVTTGSSLGVSSRDKTSDWLYVLGKQEINNWLKKANAPYTLSELTDLAISDQWWQKGGIIYAYDKTQGMAYKFTRDETVTNVSLPEQIYVAEGTAPDAIGTDGFGNLYLVKTEIEPTSKDSFDTSNFVKYELVFEKPSYKKWRGYWHQNVYKTVYKRDYYTSSISKISGRVKLGTNVYTRDFATLTPDKTSTWVWVDTGYLQIVGPVQTKYRTELAVLNNATPPKMSSDNSGVTDCVGPLVQDKNGSTVVPAAGHKFGENEVYFFELENPPVIDSNGVNLGSLGEDKDKDGRIGSFPVTIKGSTVQYYWKVIQVVDREGNATQTVIIDMESEGSPSESSILPVVLGGGEYWVGIMVKYKYYDYDKLPLGALSDEKETVLTPSYTIAKGETPPKSSFGENYSWESIKIEVFPPPPPIDGTGIIMSGMPLAAGGYTFQPASDDTTAKTAPYRDQSNKTPSNPKYVIKELSATDSPVEKDHAGKWAFKIRESNYNLYKNYDRIALMQLTNPPKPNDPMLVTGSLKWLDEFQFTWSAYLKRGSEMIYDKQVVTKRPEIYLSELRELFPSPSQPQSYSLSVKGQRTYTWKTYTAVVKYIGGKLITNWVMTDKYCTLKINSDNCQVIVIDATPPAMTLANPYKSGAQTKAIFQSSPIMYGTTGENLANVDSPPSGNLPVLDYVVADNNPMGNDATVLSYSDPFFGAVDLSLKVSHDVNNQVGTFTYSTALAGAIPPSWSTANEVICRHYTSQSPSVKSTDSRYKFIRTLLTEADFNGTKIGYLSPGDYNRSFSYVRYQINRDNLIHFYKDSGGVWLPEMDPTYANNSAGYKDLEYGIKCQDSAGQKASFGSLGKLIIRDNDRPNVFVKASEMKNRTIGHAPTNIMSSSKVMWKQLSFPPSDSENVRNGLEKWSGGSIAGFNPYIKIKLATVSSTISTDELLPFELEEDVIASFSCVSFDNTGVIATESFTLSDPKDAILFNLTSSTKPMITERFTVPGIYHIRIKIRDNALDWEGKKLSPNYRDLDCTFPVYKTGMDIHVIERSNVRTK
ncbi:MAG: hypothetical protein HQM10_09725 [Candidatus Riflebacteria bacterium]|nr:hypothetical protein [Candidatus Riflebacteria bacterium]